MSKREKTLALITGIVILGTLALTAVVDPQLDRRNRLRDEKAQLELRATKIQKDLYLKNHVESLYAQIRPFLSSAYDETRETSSFIREIREVYTQLNLKPRLLSQEATRRENGYTILSLRIDLSANIKPLLHFIDAVEQSHSPIAIRRCELKADNIKGSIIASFIITKVIATKET